MAMKIILFLLFVNIFTYSQSQYNLDERTIFNFDSTESVGLTPKLKEYLKSIVEYLKANPTFEIEIIGYSDNKGKIETLIKNSLERAINAQKYLLSLGIEKNRIFYRGVGPRNPIATNDTEEGRKKNRRIEIKIIKRWFHNLISVLFWV